MAEITQQEIDSLMEQAVKLDSEKPEESGKYVKQVEKLQDKFKESEHIKTLQELHEKDKEIIRLLEGRKDLSPGYKKLIEKPVTVDKLIEDLAELQEASESPTKFHESNFTEDKIAEKQTKKNVLLNKIRLEYGLEEVRTVEISNDDILRLSKAKLLEEFITANPKAYGLRDRSISVINQAQVVEKIEARTTNFLKQYTSFLAEKTPKKFQLNEAGEQSFTPEFLAYNKRLDSMHKAVVRKLKGTKSYLKDTNEKSSPELEAFERAEKNLAHKISYGKFLPKEVK